jgi:hypothetical protein
MSVDTSFFGAMQAAREGAAAQRRNEIYASKDAFVLGSQTPSTPSPTAGPSDADLQRQADEAAMARQLQQQAYETAARQSAVIDSVRAVFAQYGLSSLGDKIVQYAKSGMSADAIAIALRSTPEYKQRFPAMEALASKGRALSEAEYIEYERTAGQLEQRYGFPPGLLSNSVTDLLTEEVSAAELNDRAILASAAAIEAPEDLRTQMTEFYGIDQGGLAAYFLDPDRALPLLEKQYASGVIGTEARRQGVSIDVGGAESLQGFGVSQEQARAGFGEVARMGAFTQGRGDVVSQQQLIAGTFQQDEQALQNIERAQRARTGRFQEGGGFATSQQGVSGLGTAATR